MTNLENYGYVGLIRRLRSSLPLPEDIKRIKENSESVYLTSPPKMSKKLLRDKRLQQQIENFCRGISTKSGLTGHIKATIDTQTGLVDIVESERGMIQL